MTAKQRRISGNYKEKLIGYTVEFVIIFVSLFLTFELENYGENQNNREKEELYLASLEKDLDKDINQLNRRIQDYDTKIDRVYSLLDLLGERFDSRRDSIRLLYGQSLQYNFLYKPVNNTFESLKSSGDLKLIINPTFKILLSELDKSYKATIASGQAYEDFVNGPLWIGFLTKNFVNGSDGIQIEFADPRGAQEFFNLTAHALKLIEEYQYSVQGTLKKALEVQGVLEAEMLTREIPSLVSEEEEELDLSDF